MIPAGQTSGTCSTLDIPDCCILDGDCDDGMACTTDHCVISTLTNIGTCTHTPVADPLCCEPGSTCTPVAGCAKAECKAAGNPNDDCVQENATGGPCCSTGSDCPTHQCATASCSNDACSYTLTPNAAGCCADSSTCPVGNICQTPACTQAVCGYTAKGMAGCCNVVSDCPAPPPGCSNSGCSDNICRITCGGADAGPTTVDAGSHDAAATVDAGAKDAGLDANLADAPPVNTIDAAPVTPVGSLAGGGGCSIGSSAPAGTGSALAILFLGAVIAMTRRVRLQRRSSSVKTVASIAVIATIALLGAGVASAQEEGEQ